MRTLTAPHLAALAKPHSMPAIHAIIDDRTNGMARPRWTLFDTDTAADGPNAICATYTANCFLRAKVDPATNTLRVQRITDPTVITQWDWTQYVLSVASVHASAQIAFAWDGDTVTAILYVSSDGVTIYCRASSDSGATWGSAETITTLAAGHVCKSLAGSLNAGSNTLYCFYSDELAATEGSANFYSTSRPEAGGAWSAPASWGRAAVLNTRGLAVDGGGATFNIYACINRSLRSYAVPSGSLAAWPAHSDIIRCDNPAAHYEYPSIAYGFDQHIYIFATEHNTATGYARLVSLFSPNWEDIGILARPYAITAGYGAASVNDLTYNYLTTPAAVYRAKKWSAADPNQRIDASADVLRVEMTERISDPGHLTLLLRNDDGRYSADLTAGSYQAIRTGSQVSIRLGYTVSGSDLVSYCRPFWITAISHERQARRSHLQIEAVDIWGMLETTELPRAMAWTSATILTILTRILAGLGYYVSEDGNAAWDTTLTNFSTNPGTTAAAAVRRLLQLAGGQLIGQSDAANETTWPSAVAYLFIPSTSSAYTFGAAHTIRTGRYTAHLQRATHVVVLGADLTRGDALDATAITAANTARVDVHVDRRITTQAAAETLAASLLSGAQRAARAATITTQPHPGLEAGDTVTIQDDTLALNTTYSVLAITTLYDLHKADYNQTIDLGAPEWT